MTRNEIMLAAAKKRLEKANTAFNDACNQTNAAVRKTRDKYAPKERAAAKSLVEARAEVTRVELLAHGITPMHTIFRWLGAHYAVRIMSSGYDQMIYVTAKNREHRGKNPVYAPRNWS